jgi:DNA-binding transcriptional LysR family regulator
MTLVLSAVLHGAGLGVLPIFLADDDVRQGRLVRVLPRWTIGGGNIWFLTPATGKRTARAVDALHDCVAEVLAARGLSGTDA